LLVFFVLLFFINAVVFVYSSTSMSSISMSQSFEQITKN
jgi:hypothetical protein